MYSILENTHKVKKIEHVMTLTHRLYKVWYNRPTFSLAGLFCNLTLYSVVQRTVLHSPHSIKLP